jgi:hypothetical protein
MHYEISFLKSLGLTIFLETVVLWLLTRNSVREKTVSLFVVINTGFFASFATLPYLWFLLPLVLQQRIWYAIVAESLAVVFESFIFYGFLKVNFYKCLLFSLICNMSSFLTGLLIMKAFPEFI